LIHPRVPGRLQPLLRDLLELVGRIDCPLLIMHGDQDETVPVDHARSLAAAARSSKNVTIEIIEASNHVFNTPNPMPAVDEQPPSAALIEVINHAKAFAMRVTA